MKKEKTPTSDRKTITRLKAEDIINNPFIDYIKFTGLYGNRAEVKRKEYINSLAENITKYGLTNPPLVEKVGQKYEVLRGHHRIQAMKNLGWKTIPCEIQ